MGDVGVGWEMLGWEGAGPLGVGLLGRRGMGTQAEQLDPSLSFCGIFSSPSPCWLKVSPLRLKMCDPQGLGAELRRSRRGLGSDGCSGLICCEEGRDPGESSVWGQNGMALV